MTTQIQVYIDKVPHLLFFSNIQKMQNNVKAYLFWFNNCKYTDRPATTEASEQSHEKVIGWSIHYYNGISLNVSRKHILI